MACVCFNGLTKAQNIKPQTDRVDAIVTHPLILPVSVEDPGKLKSGIKVRLDDGRRVPARAYFVWSRGSRNSTGWTRSTPVWNVIGADKYTRSTPKESGTWIAIIDLPIDAVGQGIWIEEVRYEPNWLPDPMRVILETSTRDDDGFWDPALEPYQSASTLIQTAIANLRADPFNRWRAQLLTDGFDPSNRDSGASAQTDRELIAIHTDLVQTKSSAVLDEIADHFAARWQIILGRIWLIDPQVAMRLKSRLAQTATTHDGVIVPLWLDDTAQLSALAHDLLSPFVNDELRVERIDAWLDAQPQSMSWVVDDAGHPTRYPVTLTPTVGMLGLRDTLTDSQANLARIQSEGIAPVVEMLEPGVLTERMLPTPSGVFSPKTQSDEPRALTVQIGRDRSIIKALGSIPQAEPPGVLVGPLLTDWTLQAFSTRRSALGALPPDPQRVAGMVHRIAPLDEPDHRVGWRLYLECAVDDSASAEETSIGIWIGPMNATRIAWSISRSLGLVEMRSDADLNPDPTYSFVEDGDRWIIELDIPPRAINEDGFLILGLTREDASSRSSWPRRMMPWQEEPGRFVIDTTAWNGTEP
ncbi:MAG: hypothetical protein JJ974_01830 [Phycisphaerales bacterium]|nr:hypothetical protein [Phycisphaerales bacterium]